MPLHNRGGARPNAGRKSGWSTSDTQTIRVPRRLTKQLIEIAKKLDSGEVIEMLTPEQIQHIQNAIKELQALLDADTPKTYALANDDPSASVVDVSDDWAAIEAAMERLELTWESKRITDFLQAVSKRTGKPSDKRYLPAAAIKTLRKKLEGAIAP